MEIQRPDDGAIALIKTTTERVYSIQNFSHSDYLLLLSFWTQLFYEVYLRHPEQIADILSTT